MLTYQKAQELMASARNPAAGRPLENNTRLFARGADFAVQLHQTDVVTLHKSGAYTLNSGGWRTVTTKARIQQFAPVSVSAVGGHWQVRVYNDTQRPDWGVPGVLFKDHMRIASTGRIIGGGGVLQSKREDTLRAQIKAYAAEYVRKLYAGELPAPSGGDCWGCSMVNTDPASKDQYPMGGGCVREHVKENYYVPSLIIRAARVRGFGPAHLQNFAALFGVPEAGSGFNLEGFRKDYVRLMRRFCLQQCGLAS